MNVRPLVDIEHRWGRRLEVDIPVQFGSGSLERVDGQLKNLSYSGALLKTDSVLRIHSLLAVCILLPRSEPVLIEAHVTRATEELVGLEWCDFGSRAIRYLVREALASIRYRHLGDLTRSSAP